MARRTTSRMDLRRMAEAAEARGDVDTAKEAKGEKAEKAPKKARAKAAAKKPAAKRTKEKAIPRRMLMWGVYNGNMKEEGRYSFVERTAAEDKLNQLKEKSPKKLFFIQPIKVPLGDANAKIVREEELDSDDEPVAVVAARDEEE